MERDKLISLVTAAQSGDPDALNSLFNAFYNDVYYFALKTVKNDDLACDITQETFVEIINTLAHLNEPAAFVKWLKQITYHQCTRYFKKKTDVTVDEDEDGNTIFDTLAEDKAEFIPDEALDQEEFKKTILTMLDELSEEQRAAVMMFYFDEMSVKQIAEIQGISENTVKSRLNYARKAIRKSVEDYEKKNGIKLHSFGVLPLLVWVFKGYFSQSVPATSAKVITSGIASATGATVTTTATTGAALGTAAGAASTGAAATTAATATAATAVGLGAKIAALPLVAKVVAGITAASIAIGGGTAAVMVINQDASSPTEPSSVVSNADETMEGKIPEGMVYTLHDGTVLNAGDEFPESCTAGDKVLYGDYYYGYECIYTRNHTGGEEQVDWMYCKDIPVPGDSGVTWDDILGCWLPMVIDQSKTQYSLLLTEINGKRIGALWFTFSGCKNMTVAPKIPETVTSISVAFYECTSLKTAPVIPASVKRMMSAFQGCTSLTGDVYIHCEIDKTLFWYYDSVFANTINPINLTGSAAYEDLLLIANERTNRQITIHNQVINFDLPAFIEEHEAFMWPAVFSNLPTFDSPSELDAISAFWFTFAYADFSEYYTVTHDPQHTFSVEVWEIPQDVVSAKMYEIFGDDYEFSNFENIYDPYTADYTATCVSKDGETYIHVTCSGIRGGGGDYVIIGDFGRAPDGNFFVCIEWYYQSSEKPSEDQKWFQQEYDPNTYYILDRSTQLNLKRVENHWQILSYR